MKLFTGWVIPAALVLTAAAANAQVLAPFQIGGSPHTVRPPYTVVSDVDGPYAAMLPGGRVVRYGPMLLPPPEVSAIVRESGFLPIGMPQQRGLVYTIAVIDRGGDDGRLVIDARSGRIIRFLPAYQMGDNFNEDLTARYGAVGPLPPVGNVRGVPRPPRPIPRVASRTPVVPTPKPLPPHSGDVKPLAAKPAPEPAPAAEPPQQAAVQAKPADAPAVPQAAAPVPTEAKPDAPQIQPTQEMPKVQDLE